ncbi:integral membrane protein [Apiospora sp. TS-2023a]
MQDRGHELLAVGVFFLTASWAIFLLRFCSRLRLVKHFKVDDWSLIVVQLSFTLYLACQIGSAVHGSGKRESNLTQAERALALKVSVGIFLIRIAVNRSHLLVLHFLTWGTLLFGIPYAILMALQCRPIDTFWNVSPQTPGQCWDYRLMGVLIHIASALNCFADWVFGVIPFFIVRSLNITRPTKALVAWILCFAAINEAYTDRTYQDDTVDLCIWSTVEVGVGVLAWSAATCRPIHRYFLARIKAWPWMGACRTCQRRPESRDPFADGPAREIKLRPDEYFHESRCSSNGGGSASRTAKRKGSVFTVREVSEPLSVAEEGGITRTMELTQISTSRRGALFPAPPDTALMSSHLPSDEYTSVSSDTIDKPFRSRLAPPPFHKSHEIYNSARRCAIVPTKSMRNAPVSYWPKSIFGSSHHVISTRSRLARSRTPDPSPLHLMSGSIDSGHCPILLEHTKASPSPRSRGWSIPHHGGTSASPNSSKTNTNPRSTDETLVSPRQSVASFDGEENDSGSLRWSTASESSYYNGGHNQLRDTFEPFGLSAPPRAAFLRRCSHMKPPVFQPIKWRRSRDSHHRASSSAPDRLSVFAPPPPPLPVGKTHSMREFGQWSPTALRAPSRKSGYGDGSRFSTIVDDEGEREESRI